MQEIISHNEAAQEKPVRVRRTYTREFKAEIVAMCERGDRSIAQVALEHSINANLIHKWCRKLQGVKAQPMVPVAVQPYDRSLQESASLIEVSVGDNTVRFYGPVDQHSACAVLKALP